MKTKMLTFLLLAAFLIFAGCAENLTGITDSDESEADGESAESETVVVYLDNFSFHPDNVVISEGDTVKWINNYTAASVIEGRSFRSPTLRQGDSYSYTFNDRGTYNYFLISHPWTTGGIVVVE